MKQLAIINILYFVTYVQDCDNLLISYLDCWMLSCKKPGAVKWLSFLLHMVYPLLSLPHDLCFVDSYVSMCTIVKYLPSFFCQFNVPKHLFLHLLFCLQVASFPFDDHNCPPIHLITSFCQSAYSWLKEDIENVVVVHCKAGMARTGLMICSLLLYLKVKHYPNLV